MKGQKLIVGSAMVGFFLSSFAGFVGGAGLPVIFIRALIFGIIFGVLGWGAGFLAEKFLDVSSGDSASFPTSEKTAAPTSTVKSANLVDITIADENLPVEEQEPGFSVTKAVKNYHGVLNNDATPSYNSRQTDEAPAVSSVKTEKADVLPEIEKAPVVDVNESVPLAEEDEKTVPSAAPSDKNVKDNNFEGFVPDLGAATAVETEAAHPKMSDLSGSSGDSALDELPDLSELVDVDARDGGTTISDSDFASSGPSRSEPRSSGASVPDVKNTELLAQAIRSAIANDD